MNELMFDYTIDGLYFIDYIFRECFKQYDYKSCCSILYLDKKCFNFFIDYYNLHTKDIFNIFRTPTNKKLKIIYKKYSMYFFFSGSYVLSKIQNIQYSDIDIFIICDFLNFNFNKEKYEDGYKYYYTKNNIINDLILNLKELEYKRKYNVYNFSNYKMMVFSHKDYKEQFIFIGNGKNENKKMIKYFDNYHQRENFENFLETFDISCVKIYYNGYFKPKGFEERYWNSNIIKSKYPQIKNLKYCYYKHTIKECRSMYDFKNNISEDIVFDIEIFQPYRLIKYIKKGYIIQKNNIIIKFVKYLEKIKEKYDYLNNLDYTNIKLLQDMVECKKIGSLKIINIKDTDEMTVYLFDNTYLYIRFDERKIILQHCSCDFYYEINQPLDEYENETGDNWTKFYLKMEDIYFLMQSFK